MQTVLVKKDIKVLIPNDEHKNFTESDIIIPGGSIINGNFVNIQGKRRGEDFIYKLFNTEKNQLLYTNNLKPMNTEVTLGADAAQTPTKVNFIPAEATSKHKMIGLVAGGLAGFAYAKYRKQEMKKVAMFIGIGAVIGYIAGGIIEKNKVKITKSK